MNNAYKMCTAWFKAEGHGYHDVNIGEKSAITVAFSGGDHLAELQTLVVFDDDERSVAVRTFNFIKVPADKIAHILVICNELNNKFRWVKFCLDTDDNTVTVESDAIIDLDSVGSEVYELCARTYGICDDAYPILMKVVLGL